MAHMSRNRLEMLGHLNSVGWDHISGRFRVRVLGVAGDCN